MLGLKALSWSAFLAIFVAKIATYVSWDFVDPARCLDLVQGGQWMPIEKRKWAPSSCLLADADRLPWASLQKCLYEKPIHVVGDSLAFDVFLAIAGTLGVKHSLRSGFAKDVEIAGDGVRLVFSYDPILQRTIKTLEHAPTARSSTGAAAPEPLHVSNGTEAMTIYGIGYDFIVDESYGYRTFQDSLEQVLMALQGNAWKSDHVIFLPVPRFNVEGLSQTQKEILLPSAVVQYNIHLKDCISLTPFLFMSSFAEMTFQYTERTKSKNGLHDSPFVSRTQANVLLNFCCNEYASVDAPYNNTCCYRYPKLGVSKYAFVFMLALSLGVYVTGRFRRKDEAVAGNLERLSGAVLILLISLTYTYLADRTQTFGKQIMDERLILFLILMGVYVGWSLLSAKISDTDERDFMPDKQLNEWLGTSVLILTAIDFTGLQSSLIGSHYFQLYLSVFFFANALMITRSFLVRQANFTQLALSLLRFNFFVCILCLCLRTSYRNYHFPMTLTIWCLVIWLICAGIFTSRQAPSLSKWRILLILTCIVACIALASQYSEGMLQVTGMANSSGKMDGIHILALESISVFAGFLTAVMARGRRAEAKERSKIANNARVYGSSLASIVLLCMFVPLSKSHASRATRFIPYTMWIAVLAMSILRNSSNMLSRLRFRFLEFCGRYAIEALVLHYHILLAGDGHGRLLVTGSGHFYINAFSCLALFAFVTMVTGDASFVLVQVTLKVCGRLRHKLDAKSDGREDLEQHSYEMGVSSSNQS